jgi:hypothetical protein
LQREFELFREIRCLFREIPSLSGDSELFREIPMPFSKKRSLAERRRRWSLLIGGRKTILEEMPYLAGDLQDLEAVNKEVVALLARQAQYVAKTREITKKLRSLAKKGDNLRGRIGAGIRWKHGFDGAALIGFGFTPRRSKRHLEEEPGEVAEIPGEEEPAAPEDQRQDRDADEAAGKAAKSPRRRTAKKTAR